MRTNVITAAEMRAIDKNAVALGMNPLQLMENAGSAVADSILKNMPQADENGKTVWFFAVSGITAATPLLRHAVWLIKRFHRLCFCSARKIKSKQPNQKQIILF